MNKTSSLIIISWLECPNLVWYKATRRLHPLKKLLLGINGQLLLHAENPLA